MILHTVAEGQTLSAIGREYGLAPALIARVNGLSPPYALAVGQSLLLLFPEQLHTVREGETLSAIARRYGISYLQLLRNNPNLNGSPALYPGEVLVVSYQDAPADSAQCIGYAYSFAQEEVLRGILPYNTWFAPFTHGIAADGTLVVPDVDALLAIARQYGNRTLLHLSTLTESGSFSSERAGVLLNSEELQTRLIDALAALVQEKDYDGVDVDFEFLGAPLAAAYAAFLGKLHTRMQELGKVLFAALAPKTSDEQKGVLYEGHDYALVSANVDSVLLMTYEWGYTQPPPGSMSARAKILRDHAPRPTELFAGCRASAVRCRGWYSRPNRSR